MKKLFYVFGLCALLYSCGPEETNLEGVPSVTQISPEIIQAGTEVVIEGVDLNDNPILIFNGETISATDVNSNTITFNMPENASSGTLLIEFEQPEYNSEAFLKIQDSQWDTKQALGYTQIEFVSNTTGFATTVDDAIIERRIDKTIDGGQTWTTIFQEDVGDFYFTAVNANVIYAKGNLNQFKKSVNGGSTWEDFTVLDLSFLVSKLFFKNESEGYLLADKLGQMYVFRTIDGGTTWEEKLVLNTSTNKIELVYKNENSISFINKETSEFVKTTDSGENWTITDLNLTLENMLLDFHLVDSQNAWSSLNSRIENPGGLYKGNVTTNTWEAIETPRLSNVSEEKIIKINFSDELNGHLITNKGGNFYTEDGGATWKLFYLDVDNITAISIYENRIYMIANGQLLTK
jgi:photosystem II stability/assembly factor-like uncharacterized protein